MTARVEDVKIPHQGRSFAGKLFLPAGTAPVPGILFLHEILGLRDYVIRDCGDLCAEGYAVLAPDLFSMFGAARYCFRQFFNGAALTNRADNPALAEVRSCIEFLRSVERVDRERLGMYGACLTGGYVLHMAKRPDMLAPVVYHHSLGLRGSGIPDADAREIRQTIQGHFSERDTIFCPKRRSDALRGQLGDRLEYHWHPGLSHGIRARHADDEEGKRAWETTKAFFRRRLVDGTA